MDAAYPTPPRKERLPIEKEVALYVDLPRRELASVLHGLIHTNRALEDGQRHAAEAQITSWISELPAGEIEMLDRPVEGGAPEWGIYLGPSRVPLFRGTAYTHGFGRAFHAALVRSRAGGGD